MKSLEKAEELGIYYRQTILEVVGLALAKDPVPQSPPKSQPEVPLIHQPAGPPN